MFKKLFKKKSAHQDESEGAMGVVHFAIPEGTTSITQRDYRGRGEDSWKEWGVNKTKVTHVTIPSSVTTIGYGAFSRCTSLASLTIPSSVTSIADHAFKGCSSLAGLAIPSSVTRIGGYAFSRCSALASLAIPSSVTSIGGSAFYRCSSLASLAIPSSVTRIGSSAFMYCSALASLAIPSSVTSIGDYAFHGCSSLASLTIPSAVTSIGDYTFYGCSSLASLEIPSSVTSIGRNTFSGCSTLASLAIPSSVTSIGLQAFYGCVALEAIDLAVGASTTTLSLAKWDKSAKSLIKEVTIPNTVTSIGQSAFNGCTSLASVEMASSVTSIGAWAFNNCESLVGISIPSPVVSVGDCAFQRCASLTTVAIQSTTLIGKNAFAGCHKLNAAAIQAIDAAAAAAAAAAKLQATQTAEARRAADAAAVAESDVASWDQRNAADESWRLLLMGAPSGTFVVRAHDTTTTSSAVVAGTVAIITVVKPGGRSHFNQRIVQFSGSGRFTLNGSEHTHGSMDEMIKFYQDPMHFAQASQPDVPAPLVVPSFSGTGGAFGFGGGGGGTMTIGRKGKKGRRNAKLKAKYKSSRLKTLCADGNFKTMWWRKDGTGVGAAMAGGAGGGGGGGTFYGNIFDDVDGGTTQQQAMFGRMVSDEADARSSFNPLAGLESAPRVSFADAIALLKDHCRGDLVAQSTIALGYALTHPHVGTKQRPGAGALTVDDIAVLHMYTMETDFYPRINEELGGYKRGAPHAALDAVLPMTKLLAAAMAKLPPCTVKLFRGVKMDYKALLGEDVQVRDSVNWNQFTSCSTSPEVLKDENFLGPETEGTVFQIMGVTGINIKPYSALSGEDEVVLPPGSQFVVDKITPWKFGVSEVRMRQVVNAGGGASRSSVSVSGGWGGGVAVDDAEEAGLYDDVDDYMPCT